MSQFADVSGLAGQTVGRIASTVPEAAGVFQDHRVDFCGGGELGMLHPPAEDRYVDAVAAPALEDARLGVVVYVCRNA